MNVYKCKLKTLFCDTWRSASILKKIFIILILAVLLYYFYIFLHYYVFWLIAGFSSDRFDSLALVKNPTCPVTEKHKLYLYNFVGRLGNHIFEYASLLGIAKKAGMIPVFPESKLLNALFGPLITEKYKYGREQRSLPFVRVGKVSIYEEKLEKLNRCTDIVIDGFFQSWKYLDKDLIENHMKIRPELIEFAKKYIADIKSIKNKLGKPIIVGIHIRQGDKAKGWIETAKGNRVAPKQYLDSAIRHFESKYQNIIYVVCSDTISWAKDYFRGKGFRVKYVEGRTAPEDFVVLAHTDHMIITAGTFGYWAAYHVKGDVVFYKGAIKPGSLLYDTYKQEDMYPPKWIPKE